MARVRALSIRNFRCISVLNWAPSPGFNCLVGPGDSGKSSILDALDLCIGARRTAQFSDADFNGLDTTRPIYIAATLGDLPDALRGMETYGQFIRGFDPELGLVEDEPGVGLETVLTVTLTVEADLEPVWSLFSVRAAALGLSRSLAPAERARLSPTRLGGSGDANLGWRRGSVLHRLSDERPDATAALVKASRDAREAFGDEAEAQLAETIGIVDRTADRLGVPLRGGAHAYLDARSISFSGGTVSLHDGMGVPLTGLGTGSSRLLVAGLQREAAPRAGIVLVDEVEHGLEPHRLIGLLGSLGAHEGEPPLQVFATTHSPVAVRELAAAQLNIVRTAPDGVHCILQASKGGDVQGTIRANPEAYLARKVIVCEGASEVGLLRGLDLHLSRNFSETPIVARGVALVDAGGAEKLYDRANAFVTLGYRVAVLRDDDVQPAPEHERDFLAGAGKVVKWRPGRALEDELFASLSEDAVFALVDLAISHLGDGFIDSQIGSTSSGTLRLLEPETLITSAGRGYLATASKSKKSPWFKSVTRMQEAAAAIIGPHMNEADPAFREIVVDLFRWMADER